MRRPATLLLTAALALAACGGGGSAAPPSTTTAVVVEDPIPRTTAPPPTTAPPATLATTTIPPVAVTAAAPAATLPTPIAPPAENVKEPLQLLGTIDIPKLGVSEDMYEGITLPTLDLGPGQWPGSAMPGQIGNVVIAGHRVSHSKPFRYLDRLEVGDEVDFAVDGTQYVYEVTGYEVVDPTAIHIIDQTPEPTATLFACHPPGSVAERYVVHLKLRV